MTRRGVSITTPWGALFLLLFGVACGSDPAPTTTPESRLLTPLAPDTSHQVSLQAFRTLIAERQALGDSILTDAQALLATLTDDIPGYKLEIALADTLQSPLATLSEARKVFHNPKTEASIELSITDYVRDPAFLEINLQTHNLAQDLEIDGTTSKKLRPIDLLHSQPMFAFAWTSHKKAARSAQIKLVLDHRYLITIEATPQDSFLSSAQAKTWLRTENLQP